jgi:hypothetical protein
MKLPLVALLLLVAQSGHAQAPLPVPTAAAMDLAHRLAGCYRLDDGPWRADSVRVAGEVVTLAHTPLSFELTDRQLHNWEPLQSSDLPMFEVRASTSPWEMWQRAAATSDTIFLANPLAFGGSTLVLAPAGRDLVGTATAFTDIEEPGKPSHITRSVSARRVACSSAPYRDR